MPNSKLLSSISICGRMTLNLHSLNNEGGEGNQVLTRQVTILDSNGNIATVNAISGDMLKHIQSEYFWQIATEYGLPLSSSSKTFNANRIGSALEFIDVLKTKPKDSEKIDKMLEICSLTDVSGVLVTAENNNLPRKSCSEFGWMVAIPEVKGVQSPDLQSFFHVKLVPDSGNVESTDGSNSGQNIFHRPANSGVYAIVANFDIYRVGYNDISRSYSINSEDRKKRVSALLQSIVRTFISLKGAMRNTQNPHVLNFEGIITTSSTSMPSPTVSPISESYIETIEKTTKSLNGIEPDAIDVFTFKSIDEFTSQMAVLIKREPFELGSKTK